MLEFYRKVIFQHFQKFESKRCNFIFQSATEDQYWWQARKEVDKTTRAGLIPSRALQERRIIHERSQSAKDTSGNESKSNY